MTRLELASADRNMTTRKACERSMGYVSGSLDAVDPSFGINQAGRTGTYGPRVPVRHDPSVLFGYGWW